MSKKILSIVIALIMGIMMSFVAFAENSAAIHGTSVDAKPEDTVSITFSISGNPGIVTLQTEISYNAEVLTLKSVKDQNNLGFTGLGDKNLNANPYTYNWDGETASSENGSLLALEFEVAKTASDGNYNVTMNVVKARDNDGNIVTITAGTSSINVKAPTTAHTHTFGEWAVVKAATCTEKGSEERVCSGCGEKETREIAALGHTFGDWKVVKAATCTEKGSEERVCSGCGKKETREIAATGHQFGEWKVVKEATEKEEGLKERVCSVCGAKETDKIPVVTTEAPKDNNNDNNNQPPKGNNNDGNKDGKDGKTPSQPPKTTTPTKGGSIPKTGDAGVSLAVAGVIAAMSVAGVAIIMKKRNDD